MTVNKLIKLLQKAADDGYGRCPVCVDKPSFYHPLEPDGACIIDVSGTRTESVMMMNDDGGTMHGKHGYEKYRRSFVLQGTNAP